ncbi:amino acid ABC transporter permease [Ralstonia syzygii]|uniref:Amino acid ABC transporter, permease protein,3-TM region, His/Glu/Gln/Arg/opine n=1 Tax=Ralstonia syzygii R24 TaxID=907261 RepID=G3A904_9RALS|nr:amino acid ABC transporter permease [Ralstonia syzygii]CCA87744.1 amino acid ABC transporter, permease protein,3-TM region, His/Glu/Gln/Arg/opine [Ralstonia syzygii R24]
MELTDWKLLLQGAWTTLWISGLAIVVGVPAGLAIALLRRLGLRWLDSIIATYISVARATSLVTLVLLIYLGAPAFGFEVSASTASVIALALNTTAFNAEIWRSAFQAFPKEQIEAAKAAGMTSLITFRRIVFPQIAVSSLPALINEMSFLLKASPAIAVVGVVDLTRTTNRISAVTYEPLPPILAACLLYMVMVGALVWLQRAAEKRSRVLAM